MFMQRCMVIIMLLCLLSACGQPDAPGTGVASRSTVVPSTPTIPSQRLLMSTQIAAGEVYVGEYVTVRSLRARVATAPYIVIGQVTGVGEVINMARDVDDLSKPAPNMFAIGQVYHFQVQQTLKGTPPAMLNVVQPEGNISGNPANVTAADIARAKATGPDPLETGTTYLLFLSPLEYFDPALNYVTGGADPWKCTLQADGTYSIDGISSPAPNFLPNPDAPLLPQIEQIIREQQAGNP